MGTRYITVNGKIVAEAYTSKDAKEQAARIARLNPGATVKIERD